MNVLMLFGGDGAEYEISLRSAASLLPALRASHHVLAVGVARDGGWYLTDASPTAIAADAWQTGAKPVTLDPVHHTLLLDGAALSCDVAFPIMHGGLFEGGGVAALLSLLGIPYVGCPPRAGAVGMDKRMTKLLAASQGVAVARHVAVSRDELSDPALPERLGDSLGYPLFVKPVGLGSSVGAARVSDPAALPSALSAALSYDTLALCEELVVGAEVEVALLERDGELFGPLVGEIDSSAPFYDYDAKYRDRTSRIFIPARLPSLLLSETLKTAKRLFRFFGCRGLCRVDFFVRGQEILFNEINTMPGFTDVSMFPRLMAAAGLPLPKLLDVLLKNATL